MSIELMTKVWNDDGTEGAERLVLLSLADQANDKGVCWPGMATIARRANVEKRTALRCVNSLRSKGYLTVQHRRINEMKNETNIYTVSIPPKGTGATPVPTYSREDDDTTPGGVPTYSREGTGVVSPESSFNHQLNQIEPSKPPAVIFKLYQDTIGIMTPMIADELKAAETEYPAEWVEEAFKLAATRNVRKWVYVKKVLDNWKTEGRGRLTDKTKVTDFEPLLEQ